MAAKVAACFSIFIKTNMGGPGNIGRASKRDGEGKLLKSVRPGMITYLEPGEDIETANPSRSTANASQFIGTQQRLAGAGLGLSYEVTSRDFQKSSFSAARQGMLEDRKTFEPMQEFMASHFCQAVYEAFMDAAVAAGRLHIPGYFGERHRYTRADWIAPGWSWIDPQKEAAADILALQNGGMTMAQWCAGRGYDWREQLAQMALEKEEAEKMGLMLPIHTPINVQAAKSNHTNNESEEAGSDAENGDEE